ncbi:MAG: hypothetical protein K9L62_06320 [Vallitaleaceae bacterium]|nr:hypothetical protein [Vallitaleaceae bacterium]
MFKYTKSNGDDVRMRLGENGLEGANPELTDIQMYNNGMITEYSDGGVYDWSFTQDVNGNLINITNNTLGIGTGITWNGGNK